MTGRRIPQRSTDTARHGPTKARRPEPGQLHGPPPGVPRQVRAVDVRVEQLDDGRWRFTQDAAPGWAVTAARPHEAVQALRAAFTERQVAAHADWRGHVYDAAGPEHRRHAPASRGARRSDVYDVREWRLDGALWVSPRGLRYPERTQVVQRVIARRLQEGLAARPDPARPDPARPSGSACPTMSLADVSAERAMASLTADGAPRRRRA
jgi:hypothetical protein